MYIKMPDKRVAYFDIDSTLISWEASDHNDKTFVLTSEEGTYRVTPMDKNINLIDELRTVGWQIVAWSQGGADHAERTIKALKLEDKIDLIISKPTIYVDDLPFENQYIKRVFKQ